jgi:hypothetical protein
VELTNVLCKGEGDEDIKCKQYVDGFKNSWVKDDMLKPKRLPRYIQFNGGEGLPFAEYFYDCPVAGECAEVNDFWNSTLETTHPDVAYGSGEVYAVCHKMKYKLCDARLLKGGLMLRDWDLCKFITSLCAHMDINNNI